MSRAELFLLTGQWEARGVQQSEWLRIMPVWKMPLINHNTSLACWFFFFSAWHFCAQRPEWHLCVLIAQGRSCELWKPWWKLKSYLTVCRLVREGVTGREPKSWPHLLCTQSGCTVAPAQLTTAKTLLWPHLSQIQIMLIASTKCNIEGLKDFLLPFQNLPILWPVRHSLTCGWICNSNLFKDSDIEAP